VTPKTQPSRGAFDYLIELPPPEPPTGGEPGPHKIHVVVELIQKTPPKSSPGFRSIIWWGFLVAVLIAMFGG
jgi:hypothetical protein